MLNLLHNLIVKQTQFRRHTNIVKYALSTRILKYIANVSYTLFALVVISAWALVKQSAAADDKTALGMMTGTKTGTYYAIGKDMENIAASAGVRILVRESNGSVDNLQKMIDSKENAALGIVQADILHFLKGSDKPNSKKIADNLRIIIPLFREEIHILARKEIKNIEDLTGKRIVVGSSGSGSMMTSLNLLSLLNIKPANMFQVGAPEAIVAVLANRADAMIFVGGKPVPMFTNLAKLRDNANPEISDLVDKVHFLPLPTDKTGDLYEPSLLTPEDYEFITELVPTLAVRSILVTYDFTLKNTAYYRKRCQQLSILGKAIYNKLPELRSNGHSKWQEVELNREMPLWKRDKCAWPAIAAAIQQHNTTSAGNNRSQPKNDNAATPTPSALEQELLGIITSSGAN